MSKYTIKEIQEPGSFEAYNIRVVELYKDGIHMARFYGKDKHTNAQKVCDFLNETSCSQGLYNG